LSDITKYSPADIVAVNLELLKGFFKVAYKTGGIPEAAMEGIFGLAAEALQQLDQKRFAGALQLLEETHSDIQLFAPEPKDQGGE